MEKQLEENLLKQSEELLDKINNYLSTEDGKKLKNIIDKRKQNISYTEKDVEEIKELLNKIPNETNKWIVLLITMLKF